MMKISQTTGRTFKSVGYQKGLELFKMGGFSYVDFAFHAIGDDYKDIFGDNYLKIASQIRQKADEVGIAFNQAHAPVSSYVHGDDEYNSQIFDKITKSIEMTGVLGADTIIVHPCCFPDRQNHMEENIEFYNRLIPYAKAAKVKIATENMWATDPKRGYLTSTAFSYSETLKEFVDRMDSEWITVCLDVGHSCLTGREAQDEIRALKGYLSALHIHDTDYKSDLHTICYNGDQMWDEIAKALKDIGYNGDFTFECGYGKNLPNELIASALRYMYDVAEYIVAKIEN